MSQQQMTSSTSFSSPHRKQSNLFAASPRKLAGSPGPLVSSSASPLGTKKASFFFNIAHRARQHRKKAANKKEMTNCQKSAEPNRISRTATLMRHGLSVSRVYDTFLSFGGISTEWDIVQLLPHLGLGASHGNYDQLRVHLDAVGFVEGNSMEFNSFLTLVSKLVDADETVLKEEKSSCMNVVEHSQLESETIWKQMVVRDYEKRKLAEELAAESDEQESLDATTSTVQLNLENNAAAAPTSISVDHIKETLKEFDLVLDDDEFPQGRTHIEASEFCQIFDHDHHHGDGEKMSTEHSAEFDDDLEGLDSTHRSTLSATLRNRVRVAASADVFIGNVSSPQYGHLKTSSTYNHPHRSHVVMSRLLGTRQGKNSLSFTPTDENFNNNNINKSGDVNDASAVLTERLRSICEHRDNWSPAPSPRGGRHIKSNNSSPHAVPHHSPFGSPRGSFAFSHLRRPPRVSFMKSSGNFSADWVSNDGASSAGGGGSRAASPLTMSIEDMAGAVADCVVGSAVESVELSVERSPPGFTAEQRPTPHAADMDAIALGFDLASPALHHDTTLRPAAACEEAPPIAEPDFVPSNDKPLGNKSTAEGSKSTAKGVKEVRPFRLYTSARQNEDSLDRQALPERLRKWCQGARLRTMQDVALKPSSSSARSQYVDAAAGGAKSSTSKHSSPLDYFYKRPSTPQPARVEAPYNPYRINQQRPTKTEEATSSRKSRTKKKKADRPAWSTCYTEPVDSIKSRAPCSDTSPTRDASDRAPNNSSQLASLSCPRCGHKFIPSSNFCSNCGHQLLIFGGGKQKRT